MRQVIQVLVARRQLEAPDHCADSSNRFTSWALPHAHGFTLADRYLVHQRCRPDPGDDSLEPADAGTVRKIRARARSNSPRNQRWIAPKDLSLEVAKERALFAGVRWPAQVQSRSRPYRVRAQTLRIKCQVQVGRQRNDDAARRLSHWRPTKRLVGRIVVDSRRQERLVQDQQTKQSA